eukprot:scaffold159823_cov22-Tisochrysis_lutea.AAC.2
MKQEQLDDIRRSMLHKRGGVRSVWLLILVGRAISHHQDRQRPRLVNRAILHKNSGGPQRACTLESKSTSPTDRNNTAFSLEHHTWHAHCSAVLP